MKYDSFAQFYPFYLGEHGKPLTRRLHFAGSVLALACLLMLAVTRNWWWLPAGMLCGYGFAWVAHLAVEKNRPATFRHPLYSFLGDWKMFWQMLTGQMKF